MNSTNFLLHSITAMCASIVTIAALATGMYLAEKYMKETEYGVDIVQPAQGEVRGYLQERYTLETRPEASFDETDTSETTKSYASCSAGIPVTYIDAGEKLEGSITAKHCVEDSRVSATMGEDSQFNSDGFHGGDYDIALMSLPSKTPAGVNLIGIGVPEIGQKVCSSGSTSGRRCGHITSVQDGDFNVSFDSRPGDSGGMVWVPTENGDVALGVLSSYSFSFPEGFYHSTFIRADKFLEEAHEFNITPAFSEAYEPRTETRVSSIRENSGSFMDNRHVDNSVAYLPTPR